MALGEPGGDDPHHARMPPLAGQHHRRGGSELGRESGARPLGGIEHAPLGVTALPIGAVELARDRGRPAVILGEHQLDPGVRAIQTARGVDPGAKAKGQVALVEAHGLNPGHGA